MLWKGPSEKDIWHGVDCKTMSAFEKIIFYKKVKNKIFVEKDYLTRRSFQT